jgi:hypothetical protein
MSIPQGWQAEAYNQVPESENRIHSDEVARRYGFQGGLVPGVTVTSYLCHPAVDAWGMDWLERGSAHAVVSEPLYDRRRFRVELDAASRESYEAVLIDEDGSRCATAVVALPEFVPPPPVMRGDPQLDETFARPVAPRPVMEALREQGLRALRARWDETTGMVGYVRNTREMPEPLRPDGGGYANTAFILGLTNWALAGNLKMAAWLHLQTESQNHQPIPRGAELIVESAIADLFEKKGHEFVDVDVEAYRLDTREAVMTARLRAIYQLRGG